MGISLESGHPSDLLYPWSKTQLWHELLAHLEGRGHKKNAICDSKCSELNIWPRLVANHWKWGLLATTVLEDANFKDVV